MKNIILILALFASIPTRADDGAMNFLANWGLITPLPATNGPWTNLNAAALAGTNSRPSIYAGTNGPIGNGSGLTNLTGANIVGTLSNTVATATNFSGNLVGNVTGTQGATVVASLPAISGAALTSLTGANVTGTVPAATSSTVLASGATLTNAYLTNFTASGGAFTNVNGNGLTNLNATNIVSHSILQTNWGTVAMSTFHTNTWTNLVFVTLGFTNGPGGTAAPYSDTIGVLNASGVLQKVLYNSGRFPSTTLVETNTYLTFMLPSGWYWGATNQDSSLSGIVTNYADILY